MRGRRLLGPALALQVAAWLPASADEPASGPADVVCRRYYDIADYPEAISCWKQTYLRDADPAILFRIAQAYRLGGDPTSSIVFYRKFLDLKGPDYPAESRARVQSLIDEAQQAQAEHPPIAPTPQPSSSPSEPVPPASRPAPSPLRAAPPAAVPVAPEAPLAWYHDPGRDALLGTGTAVAVAGVVLVALSASDANAAPSASTVGGFHDLVTRSKWEEGIGIGAMVTGAAAIAALLAWPSAPGTTPARVGVTMTPGWAGLTLAGRF